MEITIETGNYNEKRFSRPWIARVDFTENKKGEFSFGQWIGDHKNGREGMLSIDVNPDDIIAKGQKDYRQPRNSAPRFYTVLGDGSLDELGDKGEAYKFFKNQQGNSNPLEIFSDNQIREEALRRNLV